MRGKVLRLSALGILVSVLGASSLPAATRVAVRVRSPQQPEARPRAVFSASQILDLEFHATLARRLSSGHQLEFRVYTPSGHLYEVLTAELSAPGRARGRVDASARLPVAGTSIVTSSLYGQWTVVAHLDGGAEPVSRPSTFRIKP